ncbi:MAG: ATP-binding protein [Deltaproteobacteria bacterium]|jgi:two-component system sensor histidine kinase RegB
MNRPSDLRWLITLRWIFVSGELLVVLGWALARQVPWPALLSAIASQVVSNAALSRARSWPEGVLFGLAIDVVALATLLASAGGSSSPFCVVLLVQVTVAAVALRGAALWGIVALAIGAYAALFAFADDAHAGLAEHLREMFIAFALTAISIAFAVGRLATALEQARARADASSRLMGMTTLAAGAAHELSTPLATIKTVVGELERELADRAELAHVHEDLRLVRAEVERSRAILDQLATAAGELRGEAPTSVPLSSLRESEASLPEAARGRVRWLLPDAPVRIPAHALRQALGALVKNAIEASPSGSEVDVRASLGHARLELEVEDRGSGMSAEALARVGEPFFTTKDPGRGMGLGLFLVKALAAHLGGEVTLDSSVGRGTKVKLVLPCPAETASETRG